MTLTLLVSPSDNWSEKITSFCYSKLKLKFICVTNNTVEDYHTIIIHVETLKSYEWVVSLQNDIESNKTNTVSNKQVLELSKNEKRNDK